MKYNVIFKVEYLSFNFSSYIDTSMKWYISVSSLMIINSIDCLLRLLVYIHILLVYWYILGENWRQ